jgi:hypothetical protein
MSLELPARPNIEHLKKQAKDLLRTLQQSDAAAKLADAQHQLARDYGFASWPKLKEHVDSLALTPAELLTAAIRASDSARTAHVLDTYPELKAHLNEPLANYGDGMQPILAAVQRTDRKTIDVLLQAGADINARSLTWGIGVLDECSPDFATFLIERGAVVDLHSAARLGMLETLDHLVTSNPDLVHAKGAGGQTPLHFASTVDVAEFLLDRGAQIDAIDVRHDSTPAQHMIRVAQARYYPKDRQDIARHLVARGCRTDILMASALGDLALVRRHLDSDPESIRTRVDEQYFPKQSEWSEGTIYIEIFGRNRTAHLVARDFNHEEVFRLLMDRSPEDVKLSQAFELGDESIFGAMLAAHPNLVANLSDRDRRQLPDAAQNNNTAAVRLMLAAGWPVEATGEMGLTTLQWASWHGNAEMVKEILRYHPQIDRKDRTHEVSALGSALHGSENSWHRDTGDYAATVQTLLDAGAKAPKVTDDLEASEAAREVLARHEEVLYDTTR